MRLRNQYPTRNGIDQDILRSMKQRLNLSNVYKSQKPNLSQKLNLNPRMSENSKKLMRKPRIQPPFLSMTSMLFPNSKVRRSFPSRTNLIYSLKKNLESKLINFILEKASPLEQKSSA